MRSLITVIILIYYLTNIGNANNINGISNTRDNINEKINHVNIKMRTQIRNLPKQNNITKEFGITIKELDEIKLNAKNVLQDSFYKKQQQIGCNTTVLKVNLGEKYTFRYSKDSSICVGYFNASVGVKLSLKCNTKYKLNNCDKEHIRLYDYKRKKDFFYCNEDKPKIKSLKTSEIILVYERTTKSDYKNTQFNCAVRGKKPREPTYPPVADDEQLCPGEDCGILSSASSQDNFIINGNDAHNRYQFPWVVWLKMSPPRLSGWLCGGSIIARKMILTAAHCIDRRRLIIEVYVGIEELDLLHLADQDFITETYVKHKGYNKRTIENDIGVVILDNPIIYNDYVKPICISPMATFNGLTKAIVSGWGLTSDGSLSNKLQFTEVDLHTDIYDDYCSGHWGPNYDSEKQVCSEATVTGTCNGDSGGALVAEDKGVWYQIGIVSYGARGCVSVGSRPSVYTIPRYYADWINAQFESGSCS